MRRDTHAPITCDVVRETDHAFLVAYCGEEFWLPRSAVLHPDRHREGDTEAEVWVAKWLLSERGLL